MRSGCGSGQSNAHNVVSTHLDRGILLRARFVGARNVVAILLGWNWALSEEIGGLTIAVSRRKFRPQQPIPGSLQT